MKKQFTKKEDYPLQYMCCWDKLTFKKLFQDLGETPTLLDLFNYLSIEDFVWFLLYECGLTREEKINLNIYCCSSLVPMFEKDYESLMFREALDLVKQYVIGIGAWDTLIERRLAFGKTWTKYSYPIQKTIDSIYITEYPLNINIISREAIFACLNAGMDKNIIWKYLKTLK